MKKIIPILCCVLGVFIFKTADAQCAANFIPTNQGNRQVEFDGSLAIAVGSTIKEYEWRVSSTGITPTFAVNFRTTTPITVYTFPTTGTFQVCLYVHTFDFTCLPQYYDHSRCLPVAP